MSWLFPKSHTHGPGGFWFCACSGLPIVPAEGGGGSATPQRAPVILRGRRARTVDVHIRRLRAKLGEEHANLIQTVRSVGYRFGQSRWNG